MITIPFFDYYDCLQTKKAQKILRYRIFKDAEITKSNWYVSHLRRDIRDPKARIDITNILTDMTGVQQDIDILFPIPINRSKPCK